MSAPPAAVRRRIEGRVMTLAIYCAGGLGREVLEFARGISRWDEIIFVDDVTDATEVRDARVLRFPDVANLGTDVEFIIASGEPAGRKALYEKIKAAGHHFTSLVSPYASFLPGAQIGEGCIAYDCSLSVDAVIGDNVFIGSYAIVGHDSTFGSHGVLSTNCFIGGKTHIGECVYMAANSCAKDRITVGDKAIISMGAVLLRNVRPGAIMVGNPARHLGENERGKVFGMFDE